MIYDYIGKSDDEYSVMGIDPGSNNLGVSILHINIHTGEVSGIWTQTLCLSGKYRTFKHCGVTHRMRYLRRQIRSLLEMVDPTVLAYEKGFINRFRPGAFGPINASSTIILDEAVDYDCMIQTMEFAPGEVKNAMGAKGNCNKDEMMRKCVSNPILTKFLDPYRMSEHEIDAVAVGICAMNYYSNRLYMLW